MHVHLSLCLMCEVNLHVTQGTKKREGARTRKGDSYVHLRLCLESSCVEDARLINCRRTLSRGGDADHIPTLVKAASVKQPEPINQSVSQWRHHRVKAASLKQPEPIYRLNDRWIG